MHLNGCLGARVMIMSTALFASPSLLLRLLSPVVCCIDELCARLPLSLSRSEWERDGRMLAAYLSSGMSRVCRRCWRWTDNLNHLLLGHPLDDQEHERRKGGRVGESEGEGSRGREICCWASRGGRTSGRKREEGSATAGDENDGEQDKKSTVAVSLLSTRARHRRAPVQAHRLRRVGEHSQRRRMEEGERERTCGVSSGQPRVGNTSLALNSWSRIDVVTAAAAAVRSSSRLCLSSLIPQPFLPFPLLALSLSTKCLHLRALGMRD